VIVDADGSRERLWTLPWPPASSDLPIPNDLPIRPHAALWTRGLCRSGSGPRGRTARVSSHRGTMAAWWRMHGSACMDAHGWWCVRGCAFMVMRAWMRMHGCASIYAHAWMHACERTQRVAIAVEMDDSRCRSPRPPWQMEIKDGYGRSRLGPGREETPGLAPGSQPACVMYRSLSPRLAECAHMAADPHRHYIA